MTDELTTERRERVARALRTDRYDARITNEALADAAIAAYESNESLEPEYEQVGWRRHIRKGRIVAGRLEPWAYVGDWEPVYRRVVPPQEAEGD